MSDKTVITYIGSHAELATRNLYFTNRQKPRIVALTRALSAGAQLLEDVAFGLVASRTIDTVGGETLEVFGRIVGEQRKGLSDKDYRRFIKARIQANLSEGTRDELIEIWQLVTDGHLVRYFDLFPAGFCLVATRGTFMDSLLATRVEQFMQSIKPAGVLMVLVEGLTDSFTYDDGPGYSDGAYTRFL